jgi:hypothetical protein
MRERLKWFILDKFYHLCPECEGNGVVQTYMGYGDVQFLNCRYCDGTGGVWFYQESINKFHRWLMLFHEPLVPVIIITFAVVIAFLTFLVGIGISIYNGEVF